jgi:hypothetical protein
MITAELSIARRIGKGGASILLMTQENAGRRFDAPGRISIWPSAILYSGHVTVWRQSDGGGKKYSVEDRRPPICMASSRSWSGVRNARSVAGASDTGTRSSLKSSNPLGGVETRAQTWLKLCDGTSCNDRAKAGEPRRAKAPPEMTRPRANYRLGSLYALVTAVLVATQEPFSALAARRLSSSYFIFLTQLALLLSVPLLTLPRSSRQDFVRLFADIKNLGKLAILFIFGLCGLLLYYVGLSSAHPIITATIFNLSPFWAALVAIVISR